MSDLVKRLRRKASLFLLSSGADPYMKLEDVLEWKAADEIARQDVVIERLGDSEYFDPDYAKKYVLGNPISDEWLEIHSVDREARIQYARDNRSKSE